MSKLGGGVGIDYTSLPSKGTYIEEDNIYTNSKLDWIGGGVGTAKMVSQGSTRRGYGVPFISIDDPEFEELIKRASKENTDENDPLNNNNVGIILPDGWRKRIKDNKNVDKTLRKRYRFLLQERRAEGKYYLLDMENCNKNQSPVYKKLGHRVESTNICTEALTPKYDDKSFCCNLTSLNLVYWDIIKKNPQIIKDAFMFLDICVEEFIELTEGVTFMEKARKSCIEKRDIGLGTLGFHDYLISKNEPFGGLGSRFINEEIYSTIRKYGEEYTKEIGEKLGSPKLCKEAGMVRRNVSLMMVAPNKSTAFLCGGASEGVGPRLSNYYVNELAGIKDTYKNPKLKEVLIEKGKDTFEVWESILENLGSVQHLDFLNDDQKKVFLTASEISPKDMIDLVAQRQKHIDMGQSFNLFNRPNYSEQDIYDIHDYAWDAGIKTLYYMHSQAHSALEKEGDNWDTCVSCAD